MVIDSDDLERVLVGMENVSISRTSTVVPTGIFGRPIHAVPRIHDSAMQ
jgi:hypothetical protein